MLFLLDKSTGMGNPLNLEKGVYVGYRTNRFPLPITPLTVSVQKIFAFIFGNVIFLPAMSFWPGLPYWQICITSIALKTQRTIPVTA
jgi:hypothetical protein